MNDYKSIEKIRIATGTLPSERPKRKTVYFRLRESISVKLIDHNSNPYKAMFATSTATWGDNEYEEKWPKVDLASRLEVVKAVLTGNTLPQAREMVNFIFSVRGVPRWLFDRHTQTKFTTFMSIGCRDNNKIDSDIIFNNNVTNDEIDRYWGVFEELKDLYEFALGEDQGSWQSARSFLPQNYQHSYHFGQNLLSIVNVKIDSDPFLDLYKRIVEEISYKFPLIGLHASSLFDNNAIDKIREFSVEDLDDKDIKFLGADL